MFAIIWPLRGAYGRTTNVSGSGHEPDLADRAVGRVRREGVEARERLHALHEPDPARHPPGELPDVGALAADHAAVVAVQEANELEALLVRRRSVTIVARVSWIAPRSAVGSATGPAPSPGRPRRRA